MRQGQHGRRGFNVVGGYIFESVRGQAPPHPSQYGGCLVSYKDAGRSTDHPQRTPQSISLPQVISMVDRTAAEVRLA